MKSILNGGIVLSLALVLSACELGSPEPDDAPGTSTTMVNLLALEDCTEHGCPIGCVQIQYGVDDSANGVLESTEVDGTEYVCHGTNGADGAQGPAGADGAPVGAHVGPAVSQVGSNVRRAGSYPAI